MGQAGQRRAHNQSVQSAKALVNAPRLLGRSAGSAWLRGERLDRASRALIGAYTRPARSNSAQWIDESWRLARSSAYPPDDEYIPTLSAAFHEQAKQIANRRVAEAGYRLADLLNDELGKQ